MWGLGVNSFRLASSDNSGRPWATGVVSGCQSPVLESEGKKKMALSARVRERELEV